MVRRPQLKSALSTAFSSSLKSSPAVFRRQCVTDGLMNVCQTVLLGDDSERFGIVAMPTIGHFHPQTVRRDDFLDFLMVMAGLGLINGSCAGLKSHQVSGPTAHPPAGVIGMYYRHRREHCPFVLRRCADRGCSMPQGVLGEASCVDSTPVRTYRTALGLAHGHSNRVALRQAPRPSRTVPGGERPPGLRGCLKSLQLPIRLNYPESYGTPKTLSDRPD
jgi:hypothetical protein